MKDILYGLGAVLLLALMGNHGEAESHRQVCRGAGCGGLYWDRHRRNAALDKKEKAIQAAPAG